MLRVEPAEVVRGERCTCCGHEQRTSFGFVHRDEETVAFYYAWLESQHRADSSLVVLALSLGDWTHDREHATRVGAVLRVRSERRDIEAAFIDPSSSPFHDRTMLGELLSKSAAMASVMRSQFLEVAEAILLGDPEVNEHLMG